MSDHRISDHEFDLVTACAALTEAGRRDYGFREQLSKVRAEVLSPIADFLFSASEEERDVIRNVLRTAEWDVKTPVLESRLRYASALAASLAKMPNVLVGLPLYLDRIIEINIAKLGGGFSLNGDEEVRNASVIAFFLNNDMVSLDGDIDMEPVSAEDFVWMNENIVRLTNILGLIRERCITSRADMQRILDFPSPVLVEGIL